MEYIQQTSGRSLKSFAFCAVDDGVAHVRLPLLYSEAIGGLYWDARCDERGIKKQRGYNGGGE